MPSNKSMKRTVKRFGEVAKVVCYRLSWSLVSFRRLDKMPSLFGKGREGAIAVFGKEGERDRCFWEEEEARSLFLRRRESAIVFFGKRREARSLFGEGEGSAIAVFGKEGERDRCFWKGERSAI